MKKIDGYIYSSGRTDGGIPFNKRPEYFILEGRKQYSLEDNLPVSSVGKNKLPVVPYGIGFIMCGWKDGSLKVYYYERTKGKEKKKADYRVAKSWIVSTAGSLPRVSNMKILHSGAILVAWYDEVLGSIVYPRFSYFNGKKWNTTETYFDNLSGGAPWVTADFTQDKYGTIWYFAQGDSNKNICLIQLVDNGNGVDEVFMDTHFTSKGDELNSEGESPYIVTEPYEKGVIVAYHSRHYKFFSTSPFCKGAKINVVKVGQNRVKHLIYRTEDYAERVQPFALVGTSIIYGPINPETLRYNEMYLLREDGTKTFLVTSKYPMMFRYTNDRYFCNGLDGNIIVVDLTK